MQREDATQDRERATRKRQESKSQHDRNWQEHNKRGRQQNLILQSLITSLLDPSRTRASASSLLRPPPSQFLYRGALRWACAWEAEDRGLGKLGDGQRAKAYAKLFGGRVSVQRLSRPLRSNPDTLGRGNAKAQASAPRSSQEL